ncbi:MAG: reprolysin-like metallopeptidase [Candidatus Methylomirabilis sp.]
MPEHKTGGLSRTSKRALVGGTLSLILGLAIFIIWTTVRAASLFQDLPDAERQLFEKRTKALIEKSAMQSQVLVRFRDARLDWKYVFENAIQPGLAKQITNPISIKLFDDVSVKIVTDSVQRLSPSSKQGASSESYRWVGHIEGEENKKAIFIFLAKNGTIRGTLRYKGKLYQIQPVDQGVHSIYELDQSKFPDELPPVKPRLKTGSKERRSAKMSSRQSSPSNAAARQAQRGGPPVAGDVEEGGGAPEIAAPEGMAHSEASCNADVLVMYTTNAKKATDDIEEEIRWAEVLANISYELSGINLRIKIVETNEVSYQESGDLGMDLQRLLGGDGKLAGVHSLRNASDADLVSLWVESGNDCGIGFVNAGDVGVTPAHESTGYSVLNRACGLGNLSFAHELGHNMGANHDRHAEGGVSNDGKYNYGHVNVATRERTIMAYNKKCRDAGFFCERVPYWSNPDNPSYADGSKMGKPQGDPDWADNRKTLNEAACTVSKFRPKAQPG